MKRIIICCMIGLMQASMMFAQTTKKKLQTRENYEFDFDLPRYVEDLKKELTYPMAWGNSPIKNFNKWKKVARQKVFDCMMTPPKKAASWDMEVLAEEQRDGYKAQKIAFNVNAYSCVTAYLLIPNQAFSNGTDGKILGKDASCSNFSNEKSNEKGNIR